MFHVGYPISLICVFVVFYYALLCFYHCILRIDVFSSTAARVFNKLTYLFTYLLMHVINYILKGGYVVYLHQQGWLLKKL